MLGSNIGSKLARVAGAGVLAVVIAACAASTTMHSGGAEPESISDVRVGLASGPVLEREGDLFGPTVNLASRIAGIAYPGGVVVSESVRDAVDDEDVEFHSIRAHTLRDIGRVRLWVARRRGEERSLLDEALRELEYHGRWSIRKRPGQYQVVCARPDGREIVGTFKLSGSRVRPDGVQTQVVEPSARRK